MSPLDSAAVSAQIEAIFSRLHQELAQADSRQRCELTQAAVTTLQSLRDTCGSTITITDLVDAALNRAGCLYDTFHQELQYELEWASSGSTND